MEINVEHILDCLDQYGKSELTEKQLTKALTYDEKMFLIMHQGLLGENSDSEEDFDVLECTKGIVYAQGTNTWFIILFLAG